MLRLIQFLMSKKNLINCTFFFLKCFQPPTKKYLSDLNNADLKNRNKRHMLWLQTLKFVAKRSEGIPVEIWFTLPPRLAFYPNRPRHKRAPKTPLRKDCLPNTTGYSRNYAARWPFKYTVGGSEKSPGRKDWSRWRWTARLKAGVLWKYI